MYDLQQCCDIRKINRQSVANIDFDGGSEAVLFADDIFFKIVDKDCFPERIHDPVLTDTGFLIVVQLSDIVIGRVAGRNDLDDEIGCAIAAFVIKLVFVAYNHQIRLDNGQRVVAELDIKRSGEYGAIASLFAEIAVNLSKKLSENCLMYP